MFRWAGQLVFAAGILHATAFWLVGEYHIMQHYLDKNSKEKTDVSKAHDPFQPTFGDILYSVSLLISSNAVLQVLSYGTALIDYFLHCRPTLYRTY